MYLTIPWEKSSDIKMKGKIALFVLPILILFLTGIVSAETLIGGKIYNSYFDSYSEAASVTISCSHGGQAYSKSTSSVGDGTYAVEFEEGECSIDDSVTVTATKADFSGDSQGTIKECDGDGECEADYFAIVNVIMRKITTPSNGGSSGGGSCTYNKDYDWQCGEWGECIDGVQARTCKAYNNCGNSYGRPETSKECSVEASVSGENGLTTTSSDEGQESRGGITGAVIGMFDSASSIGVIIFIIAIVVIAIFVAIMRRRAE